MIVVVFVHLRKVNRGKSNRMGTKMKKKIGIQLLLKTAAYQISKI